MMDECDAIFMSIRRISHAIDRHSKRMTRNSGLSVPQLLVMRTVQQSGSVPIQTIARLIWLSPATVSTIIDRLEQQGLVQRERSSIDRRVVHVVLTQQGGEKLALTPDLVQAEFAEEFNKLTDWERQMLMSSLDRVAQMLTNGESVEMPLAQEEAKFPPPETKRLDS